MLQGATALAAARAARAGAALPIRLDRLKGRLKGRLITPADPDYEAARRVKSLNPQTDQRPLAIARCADADDVARSIEATRRAGLDLAVRAGGHDVLGASTCAGGVVIDLSAMTRVLIDRARSRASVAPGVISGKLALFSQDRGLAPVLGCHPDVGVAGLTLGGGVGWLRGAQGAACDHLLSAEVVTADGELRRAGPDKHPDLYWALRGGGGNFGVVTSLELGLIPASEVLAGPIAFSASEPGSIAAFLRFYRDFTAAAPDPMTVELSLFGAPAPVIVALVCWSGPLQDGEPAVARLRGYAKPLFDGVRKVAYAHLTDRPAERSPQFLLWRGASLDGLSDAAAEAFEAMARQAPPGWSVGLGHVMRGQIVRVPDDATPFIRREGQVAYFIGAGWNDPADGPARMAWVEATMENLAPLSSPHAYVNYLSDDRPGAVRQAYGANFERLRRIKRRYDPENVFHRNRNIRP